MQGIFFSFSLLEGWNTFLAVFLLLRRSFFSFCLLKGRLQISIAVISVMFSYTVYRSKIEVILSSIFAFNKGKNTFLTIFLKLNRNFSSLGKGSYADQHYCNLCHGSKLILQIQLKDAGDYVFRSLLPSNKSETLLWVSSCFWVGLSSDFVKVLLQNSFAVFFFFIPQNINENDSPSRFVLFRVEKKWKYYKCTVFYYGLL